MIPIADRNTGIWNDVLLIITDKVRMQDIHIDYKLYNYDDLNSDDKNNIYNQAIVCVTVIITNGTSDSNVKGVIKGNIKHFSNDNDKRKNNDGIEMEDYYFTLAANEQRVIQLKQIIIGYLNDDYNINNSSENNSLDLKLWWPIAMGDQNLYECTLDAFVIESSDEEYSEDNNENDNNVDCNYHSHSISTTFGLRSVFSYIDSNTGGRIFMINGIKTFIRGVNYTLSDGWLNDYYQVANNNGNKNMQQVSKMYAELLLLSKTNINMIRLWGGSNTANKYLLLLCQKLGILVWFEFWITGDCNGRGIPPTNQQWPLDHSLFLENAIGRRMNVERNHDDDNKIFRTNDVYIGGVCNESAVYNNASIVIYCGGNEQKPAPDIDLALTQYFGGNANNSNSDKLYVSGSLWSGFGSSDGAFQDGPYGICNPKDFYIDGDNTTNNIDDSNIKNDNKKQSNNVGVATLPYKFGFNPEIGR